MIKYINILVIAVFIISCSNKKEMTKRDIIINDRLKDVLMKFQKREVPNKDKVILIEFWGDISRRIYQIRKIEYPHLFDDLYQYHVIEIDSSFFFFSSPFAYDLHIAIDTANVKKIVKKLYAAYNEQEGYEVDFRGMHDSWYYIHGLPPKIFNMTDSIKIYKNIGEQYSKLDSVLTHTQWCGNSSQTKIETVE